mmetsp:Transcript_4347/g.9908  ORF Transcript_4347/g.9908 Transcript_4347/m.9908 type:complete len:231 (+) Transcript_4347:37-729(+)
MSWFWSTKSFLRSKLDSIRFDSFIVYGRQTGCDGHFQIGGHQLLELFLSLAGKDHLVRARLVIEVVPPVLIPGVLVGVFGGDHPLGPVGFQAPRQVLSEFLPFPRRNVSVVLDRQGVDTDGFERRVAHPVLPRDGPRVRVGEDPAGQEVGSDVRVHVDGYPATDLVPTVGVLLDELREKVPPHDPPGTADSGADEIALLGQGQIPDRAHGDTQIVVGLDVEIIVRFRKRL